MIDEFMLHLWSGKRAAAKLYIESTLPMVLSMAANGKFAAAMTSVEEMKEFVDHLAWKFDRAADMDW